MQRPLSITIIGVIGVVWGLLGTLSGIGGLYITVATPEWFTEFVRRSDSPEASLFLQAMRDSEVRLWRLLSLTVQTGLNALLFFGAIGLLRLQPRGWWLMTGYIIGALLWLVVDRIILNETVYEGFRQRYQIEDRTARPVPRLLLGALYPTISAYFLTRPKIMALYKQEAGD
ncbi:MAG: hypothetical protein WHS44_03975 [Fimbriimonadales bacterium]